jgi:hypothetical protein
MTVQLAASTFSSDGGADLSALNFCLRCKKLKRERLAESSRSGGIKDVQRFDCLSLFDCIPTHVLKEAFIVLRYVFRI